MKIVLIFITCVIAMSCNIKKSAQQKIGVNYRWLDSISKSSDTAYTKKYGTAKFAKAEYYNNKGNATVCQVMKDASDSIRQIIVSKNNKRTFFAEYYPNGQLVALLSLDSFGQYQGHAIYYYENGFMESTGDYKSGFKTGVWENYKESGELIGKNKYDSNGQVIPAITSK